MKILTVHRNNQGTYNKTTTLIDNNNKVKAVINGYLNQPKKNQKTIKVAGVEYGLDWQFCAKKN